MDLILSLQGRERAKEQQVQEAKEQWELEAEQKDRLKSALSGGLKGAKKLTAILFENIETIRGKIIQGKALKILFVLPIAVFVILLLFHVHGDHHNTGRTDLLCGRVRDRSLRKRVDRDYEIYIRGRQDERDGLAGLC